MSETVRLLLVPSDVVSFVTLRQSERATEEDITLELGLPALESLCRAVLDQPVADPERTDFYATSALEYLDGPPDPRVDDGVQLFRFPAEFVKKLAGADGRRDAEYVARWRAGLLPFRGLPAVDAFLREGSLPETTFALVQDAAYLAAASDRALCLSVLYR